ATGMDQQSSAARVAGRFHFFQARRRRQSAANGETVSGTGKLIVRERDYLDSFPKVPKKSWRAGNAREGAPARSASGPYHGERALPRRAGPTTASGPARRAGPSKMAI